MWCIAAVKYCLSANVGLSMARSTVRMAVVINEEAGVLSKVHQHRTGGTNTGMFQERRSCSDTLCLGARYSEFCIYDFLIWGMLPEGLSPLLVNVFSC